MRHSLNTGSESHTPISLFAWGLALFFFYIPSALQAEDTYSLVVGGRIYDVSALQDPSVGHLLSAEMFSLVAKADARLTVATRPDRGHIVLAYPGSAQSVPSIEGFKTATITLVANGTPTMTRARLVKGVPYLEPTAIQTALEALKFNVLISHESFLISIFRTDEDSTGEQASAGEAGGTSGGGVFGSDMMKAVQHGSADALRSMGATGGYGTQGYSSLGSGDPVCGAMDSLRTLWEETEPNVYEKATFQSLADKFQQAKDNKGELDPADVDQMIATLQGFRKKVDRRTQGTGTWSAPTDAGRVKSYGVSFLDSFNQAMDLSQEMMQAIKNQDQEFVKEAEDLINTLKSLERTIQEQGTRFNDEVVRVRKNHGCGPAKLGLPPS